MDVSDRARTPDFARVPRIVRTAFFNGKRVPSPDRIRGAPETSRRRDDSRRLNLARRGWLSPSNWGCRRRAARVISPPHVKQTGRETPHTKGACGDASKVSKNEPRGDMSNRPRILLTHTLFILIVSAVITGCSMLAIGALWLVGSLH